VSDLTLLERVNAVTITSDDMVALVEASNAYMQEHPDEARNGTAALMLAAKQGKSAERGVALWSRLSALAQLIDEEGCGGWALPNPAMDDGVFAQDVLFAAAAVHPLVEADEAFVFDRESFLSRAIAMANADTRHAPPDE